MSPTHRTDLEHPELFTDLYEIRMAEAHFARGTAKTPAVFDYFFRSAPFGGSYALFCGLEDLLSRLETLRFGPEALGYLEECGARPAFLEYLSAWRFSGSIEAAREGEVVFPLEPIVRVEASAIDGQLIEPLLLNTLNFQTLIATKAARIVRAAGGRAVTEFGLRRAQGLGALQASRAAIVGGVGSTSNVHAAFAHGAEARGTQAHAWVQSFPSERAAFKSWAELFPDQCVLLVDTYDTLGSGVPNAIACAKELPAPHRLRAIRLDSGDLAYLSKRARRMLDEAGLEDCRIYATNQLDERLIASLIAQGAPIDVFGVGTRLVTGHPDAALGGVYKLASFDGRPTIKVSDNFTKVSLPGRKKVWRYADAGGQFVADGVALDSDPDDLGTIRHPFFQEQRSSIDGLEREALLVPTWRDGRRTNEPPSLASIAAFAASRLARLPEEHHRLENPHIYKVGLSERLLALRGSLYEASRQGS